MEKSYYSKSLKKSITIQNSPEEVWNIIKKTTELKWLEGIKSSKSISSKKHGIGSIRKISFISGIDVEEIIVGWRPKKYLSYIAISGLPLRGYHATISITAKNKNSVHVEWESFFSSELMTQSEFREFYKLLSNFYANSLKNLRNNLKK